MRLQSLLPDKKRLHLDHVFIDDEKCMVEVAVRSSAKEARCPKCGQASSRVHSRYRRCLADLPWQGFSVVLTWQTRRFYCRNKECVQKIFTERIPEIAAPHARRTERLSLALRCIAFSCGGEGGSRLADRLGMVLSPDSMLRELRRMSVQPKPVPQVLGVDDWAFRKRRRYGTVLIDLERGSPVDLLPDRNADSLKQWLKEHPGVEIISRDRADCYIKGATGDDRELSRNRFPISDRIGNSGVIPFREVFVEFDCHHCLEVSCVFATDFVDFVHDPHNHIQASRRLRFFDVVLGCFNGLQRDAFASACDVRKHAVFDRIIF